jgi:sirohydrochlorin ferrochelatase
MPGVTDGSERTTMVVLVAHGSRNNQANETVIDLCARWSEQSGVEIRPAFLELARPSIPEALRGISENATDQVRVVLVPYLLLPGNHTQRDIPRIVDDCAGLDKLTIELSPHVGDLAVVQDAVLSALSQFADPT